MNCKGNYRYRSVEVIRRTPIGQPVEWCFSINGKEYCEPLLKTAKFRIDSILGDREKNDVYENNAKIDTNGNFVIIRYRNGFEEDSLPVYEIVRRPKFQHYIHRETALKIIEKCGMEKVVENQFGTIWAKNDEWRTRYAGTPVEEEEEKPKMTRLPYAMVDVDSGKVLDRFATTKEIESFRGWTKYMVTESLRKHRTFHRVQIVRLDTDFLKKEYNRGFLTKNLKNRVVIPE